MLALLLVASIFLSQRVIGPDAIEFYVSVTAQPGCLEVVTSSTNGFVAFKTGNVPREGLTMEWTRKGLRKGTYFTEATLTEGPCGFDGKTLYVTSAKHVTLE